MFRPAVLALLVAFSGPTVWCVDTLDSTFAHMDKAAAGFKGVQAKLAMDSYLGVINEHNKASGTIVLKRSKPREIKMLVNLTEPDPKQVGLSGHKLEMYYPKLKTVQEFDVGTSKALFEQFFLVGFGTTSAEMKGAYDIRFEGPETVAGQKTSKLELTPKSKEVLQHMTKLELWVNEAGLPAQQKFYFPGNEYKLVSYSSIQPGEISENDVKLKLPAGVKRERPQK